jgi:hypothetical protein
MGTLRIKSTPAGARVWIDHVEVGRTPYEVKATAGVHQVRVAADYHTPYSQPVMVVARRVRPVSATLKKGNGGVEINTDIDGTQITIKTKVFDSFPLRLTSLKENTYSYRVTAPGHEPYDGEFTWKKGKNIYLWLKLQSSLGRFVVTTNPPGATVTMDGNDLGPSPIDIRGVEQGKHLIHVQQRGHADLIRIVDTSDGSKGELDLTMTKKGARVVVRTGHKQGTLSVEGIELASGRRIVFSKLERGRYAVEIAAPGKKAAVGRMVIPARGVSKFKGNLKRDQSRSRSTVERIRPFYAQWTFWTAIGVTAGGATTGSVVYWNAIQPIPIDTGDQRVSVP